MLTTACILRLLAIAGVLIFVASQPGFIPSHVAYAAPTVSISSPSGNTPLGEDEDYMSHEWHDAWDMNQESDIYFYQSPTCNAAGLMYSSILFSSGVFSANQTGAPDRPWLWLIHPGYPGTLHVGKDGNVHAIDATKYTQLTFRMYMNAEPSNGTHLIWTNTDTSGLSQPSQYGLTEYFRGHAGWNVYTVDLTKAALIPTAGTLSWTGNITGLGLFTGDTGVTSIKIDWIRLTPKPTTRTVSWSGSWQSSATAQLSFSADNVTFDPLYVFGTYAPGPPFTTEPDAIPAGPNGNSGSYTVPASFPAGPQYIKVQITDGTGSTLSGAAGPWQFNALPDFTFVAPSYTSGADFATNVVGNAWDMTDSADVASWANLTGAPTFSNGILTATSSNSSTDCSTTGDPILFLNMNGQSIDPNTYRYFTVRIKMDAPFDFGNGWISRVIWQGNTGTGVSNDLPLYQNPDWNTNPYWSLFHVDMWGNVNDESGGGNLLWRTGPVTLLRFDPYEIPRQTQFDIDYIKLTANDTARRNGVFQIKYLLDARYNATFCFNTNRNPNTGCTSATASSSAAPPAPGPLKLFLPLIFDNVGNDPPGTRSFYWNVAADSVTTGSYYYLCASVNDSFNTTKWCSETPLLIVP